MRGRRRERGDGSGSYITGETASTEDELQARLAVTLPDHMVPARIIRLEALPLTSSGKVDRRRLSHLLATAQTLPGRRRRASTVTAEIVASIYSEVLKAGGRVDIDLSFFALGGHSLTAMRVAMRLAERLGLEVPVRLIFEHPSARDGRRLDRLAPTARTSGRSRGWHVTVGTSRPSPRRGSCSWMGLRRAGPLPGARDDAHTRHIRRRGFRPRGREPRGSTRNPADALWLR